MRRALAIIMLCACTSEPVNDSPRTGFVSLTTSELENPTTVTGAAFADFYERDNRGSSVTSNGPCEVYTSDVTVPDGFDAGLITVSGTSPGITLTPDTSSHYMHYGERTRLFGGGETLMISAGGGEVPAFSSALTAPSKITVTAPPPPGPGNGELVVPHGQDLTLNWTPGLGLVQLFAANEVSNVVVMCRFPAADSMGTVPHAALAAVDNGAGVSFSIDSIDLVEVTAGKWNVELSATFNGIWPNNQLAFGVLTFQ